MKPANRSTKARPSHGFLGLLCLAVSATSALPLGLPSSIESLEHAAAPLVNSLPSLAEHHELSGYLRETLPRHSFSPASIPRQAPSSHLGSLSAGPRHVDPNTLALPHPLNVNYYHPKDGYAPMRNLDLIWGVDGGTGIVAPPNSPVGGKAAYEWPEDVHWVTKVSRPH